MNLWILIGKDVLSLSNHFFDFFRDLIELGPTFSEFLSFINPSFYTELQITEQTPHQEEKMCEDTSSHYDDECISNLVLSFWVWPDVREYIGYFD